MGQVGKRRYEVRLALAGRHVCRYSGRFIARCAGRQVLAAADKCVGASRL